MEANVTLANACLHKHMVAFSGKSCSFILVQKGMTINSRCRWVRTKVGGIGPDKRDLAADLSPRADGELLWTPPFHSPFSPGLPLPGQMCCTQANPKVLDLLITSQNDFRICQQFVIWDVDMGIMNRDRTLHVTLCIIGQYLDQSGTLKDTLTNGQHYWPTIKLTIQVSWKMITFDPVLYR